MSTMPSSALPFTLVMAFVAALNGCNGSAGSAPSGDGPGPAPTVPGGGPGMAPVDGESVDGESVDGGSVDGGTPPPTPPSQAELDQKAVEASRDAVVIGFTAPGDTDVNRVSGGLILPTSDPANGVQIAWLSSNPDLITNTGQVTRPPFDFGHSGVTLTATFTKGAISVSRDFELIVAREPAFFVRNEKMYRTDGTYTGTEKATWVPLAGLIPESPKDNGPLPVLGNTVFFVAREREHATQGRIPLAGGGELYGFDFVDRTHIGAIDVGPGALSGVPERLVWEYAGTGNDKKVRFHALDVAPGNNVNNVGLQCTDVQIWETDGVWRGVPKSLSATKVTGCHELYSVTGPIIVHPLDPAAQLNLQNLLVNAVNYNASKVIVNFNANGDKPLTSGTLALAMLDFGDYLRPHIEDRIKQLDALIAAASNNGASGAITEYQSMKSLLNEALDKYIGENKSDANKQEFMSRMTSSGEHAAFMGDGKDLNALANKFTAQQRDDLKMRLSLSTPLGLALLQAIEEGKTLSVSQKNIAARVAKHINTKRVLLGQELDRLHLEHVKHTAQVGANNMWAFKTLPDIALTAEQIAHGRLTAAAVGAGAGAVVGGTLAVGVYAAASTFFKAVTTSVTLGATAVTKTVVSASTIAAGAIPGLIATAVGALVIGAVSVAMLIEEAENKQAFDRAHARASTMANVDLSNLDLMNNTFDQGDYVSGFTATFAEIP